MIVRVCARARSDQERGSEGAVFIVMIRQAYCAHNCVCVCACVLHPFMSAGHASLSSFHVCRACLPLTILCRRRQTKGKSRPAMQQACRRRRPRRVRRVKKARRAMRAASPRKKTTQKGNKGPWSVVVCRGLSSTYSIPFMFSFPISSLFRCSSSSPFTFLN